MKEYIYWIPNILICNNQNRPLSTMNFNNLKQAMDWGHLLARVNKETVFFKSENGFKIYQVNPEPKTP